MINILIADDHPVVREGIKQIIAKSKDMTVTAEASNGQEVIEKICKYNFDVIILDIAMPGRDGFEVIKELKRMKPKIAILVLSIYPEDQIGIRVLENGASGYLNKESAPSELINAIIKIHNGRKYISSNLVESLASRVMISKKPLLHENLSNREYQILCLIASGKDPKEIADRLSISIKSVRTYRERIHQKLMVKNDVELTHYAIQNKII
ncbi:MAG: response regulator transcription factor [Bacteroidetes bacterium]|nr:response regulator transcription factor [Bacteroidota bacterium]